MESIYKILTGQHVRGYKKFWSMSRCTERWATVLSFVWLCTFIVNVDSNECLQTTGAVVNTGSTCKCGTAFCDGATGMFCFESSNKCTNNPCAVLDGSSANENACTCGSSDCDATTGMFCMALSNACRSTAIVHGTDPLPATVEINFYTWDPHDCTKVSQRKEDNICGISDIWIAGYFKSCYEKDASWSITCNPSSDTITAEEVAAKDVIEETYGHMSNWDVSRVTRMYGLFYSKKTFNLDLSKWNVSAVTSSMERSKLSIS